MKVAIIGAGIAGLSAAWLLARHHHVSIYEERAEPGGHANAVTVETGGGPAPVDTGFILFNEHEYTELTALFRHLDVPTRPAELSFSISLGRCEYGGSTLVDFFGAPRNLARREHWRLLAEIRRFRRMTTEHLAQCDAATLGDLLHAEGYSRAFTRDHILPLCAAISSPSMLDFLNFPAAGFVEFYMNHNVLSFPPQHRWRTVRGASRTYVERLMADMPVEILPSNAARQVIRQDQYALVRDSRGVERPFDHVIIATNARQALALLGDPTPAEHSVLSNFNYQTDRSVLHRDNLLMPRRRRLWSSWNYLRRDQPHRPGLFVTYWLNRLQGLGANEDFFLTGNPTVDIPAEKTVASFDFQHLVLDADAVAARSMLPLLSDSRHTSFCGSYFGLGSHEDGVRAGLAAAEKLTGLSRPWTFDDASGSRPVRPPEAISLVAE